MTLRRRVDRLESRHGIGDEQELNVIVLVGCWRDDEGHLRRSPGGAYVKTEDGWQTVSRNDGETEAEFSARLDAISAR